MYMVEVKVPEAGLNEMVDLAWNTKAVEVRLLSRSAEESRIVVTFDSVRFGRAYEAAAEITRPNSVIFHANTKELV